MDHPELDFRCIYLTAPRAELYARIDARCEALVQNGLVEETIRLLPRGLEPWTAGARAVGYRQAIDYVQSDWLTSNYRSPQGRRRKLLQFIARYQAATRGLARKQQAWFRHKEPDFWWLLRETDDEPAMLAELIADKFAEPTWTIPSSDVAAERAEHDRAQVRGANLGRYRSVPVLYAEQSELDAKIEQIRAVVFDEFPSDALRDEIADLADRAEEKARGGGGRRSADRYADADEFDDVDGTTTAWGQPRSAGCSSLESSISIRRLFRRHFSL